MYKRLGNTVWDLQARCVFRKFRKNAAKQNNNLLLYSTVELLKLFLPCFGPNNLLPGISWERNNALPQGLRVHLQIFFNCPPGAQQTFREIRVFISHVATALSSRA